MRNFLMDVGLVLGLALAWFAGVALFALSAVVLIRVVEWGLGQ